MSTPTTTTAAAPAPAADALFRVQVGNSSFPAQLVANSRTKDPAKKGTAAWKPVISGDVKKPASLNHVVAFLTSFGIGDALAGHIEKDLILPLVREASELCQETTAEGKTVLNPARIPEALTTVIKAWSTSKTEVNDRIREQIVALNDENNKLFNEFNTLIASMPSDISSAEAMKKWTAENLAPLSNRMAQNRLRAAELAAKLAPKANKK